MRIYIQYILGDRRGFRLKRTPWNGLVGELGGGLENDDDRSNSMQLGWTEIG